MKTDPSKRRSMDLTTDTLTKWKYKTKSKQNIAIIAIVTYNDSLFFFNISVYEMKIYLS